MTSPRRLPPEFAELSPFVERWAASNSNDRTSARLESSAEERLAFYEAAKPHLDRALAYLDGRDVRSEADDCLLDLVLTLAHVALAIEQQKEVEQRHARAHAHFSFQRSAAEIDGSVIITPSGTS